MTIWSFPNERSMNREASFANNTYLYTCDYNLPNTKVPSRDTFQEHFSPHKSQRCVQDSVRPEDIEVR
jgi:hypothetical protein